MSKKLPQISSDIPRDLRMFTDRLREIISANGDDRFVTAKELASAGVVKIERSGTVANPLPFTNRPPAPQNVTVVGDVQTIVISWDAPTFSGFSVAEVWGHSVDDVNAAHKVGTSPGINYRDPVGPLTSKYYWVRFINTAGKPGPFASATGGLGETGDVVTYTVDDLKDDLAAGAVQVIAGALNSDSIIKTFPTYMAFQHKDAVPNGSSGAYTGDFRTALGITSTGIIAGYNDKTTGAWQTTLAVEAATGNLTVLGTIKANSVIQAGAYLGTQTVSSVISNIASKLTAQSVYILGSDFALKTSSYDSGSGIIITNTGILGKKSGVTTFAIDNTGSATFAGDVVTSGQVYVTGSNTVVITDGTGSSKTYNVAIASMPTATAAPAFYGRVKSGGLFSSSIGIFGEVDPSANGGFGYGIIGSCTGNSGLGVGVYGFGGEYNEGVFAATNAINNYGISAYNGNGASGAYAMFMYGKLRWGPSAGGGNVNISPPDGGIDKYLRNDGTWASVGSIGGGTVTQVLGSGSVNGLSLSGNVTTSGSLTLSGSVSIAASQVTSGTFPPARLASGGVGILYHDGSSTSYRADVATFFDTNSGRATASNFTVGLLGSTYTGIAGAYVNVSGNSNNCFFNVSATSPSDRRLKENIADCDLGLAFVNQLQAKKYSLIADAKHQTGYGFIADEVAALGVYGSSLVYHEAEWKVGDVIGFDTIHYPSYVAILTKAVQELSAKVHALENANDA